MTFPLEVLVLGLILSADSFSAAVAMGSCQFTRKDLLKFSAASSGAEALAALAGYFAGAKIIAMIAAYDHWVAFFLLLGIAIHMFIEGAFALKNGPSPENEVTSQPFSKMLLVSVATSMDAFGVGIGLGLAGKPITPYCLSIGFWAFVSTWIGVCIGNRASKKLGPIFTILASFILGYLATKMLSI